MKLIYRILSGLLIFSAILYAFFWLFFTTAGLQWTISNVGKFLPGKLVVVGLDGDLVSPISISQLSYRNQDRTISAKNIMLRWQLSSLFIKKIKIDQLHAKDVTLSLPTTVKAKVIKNIAKSSKFRINIEPPAWNFELNDIKLNNIAIQKGNQQHSVTINEFEFALNLQNKNVKSITCKLVSPKVFVSFQGNFEKRTVLSWLINIANLQQILPELSGAVKSNGTVNYFNEKNFNAKVDLQTENLAFRSYSIAKTNTEFNVDSTHRSREFIFSASKIKIKDYTIGQVVMHNEVVINPSASRHFDITMNLNTLPFKITSPQNSFAFQQLFANIHLTQDGLSSKIKLFPLKQAAIIADLSLDPKNNIEGHINWDSNNPEILGLFLPDVKHLTGNINASLTLAGKLFAPEWQGSVNLTRFNADIPFLNISLRNSFLKVAIKPNVILYNGSIFGDKGSIAIAGKTTISENNNFNTNLDITGADFQIANTKMAKVKISPSLNLTATKDRMSLTGTVFVPMARLETENFTGVETLPQEVVFEDKPKNKAEVIKSLPYLHSEINLILGDSVNINMMGLKGQVLGKIKVSDGPSNTTIANGIFTLNHATYDVYGQSLEVERGSFNFNNSTLDNPNLDIRAVRTIESASSTSLLGLRNTNILVGVHIQGTQNKPVSSLFSTPSDLSQEDIVSYLILGQASSQVGKDQVGTLFGAMKALNFGGASKFTTVTDSLRKKLGFTELGLATVGISDKETGQTTTTTAVVVGRYLTPSLYLSYSMGILQQFNIFKVKYFLRKNLILQTENSTVGTGVDVLYNISKE